MQRPQIELWRLLPGCCQTLDPRKNPLKDESPPRPTDLKTVFVIHSITEPLPFKLSKMQRFEKPTQEPLYVAKKVKF